MAECTFIVLDKARWMSGSCTEEDCMVGDVNLFLIDSEDLSMAEIEIMIAGWLPLKAVSLRFHSYRQYSHRILVNISISILVVSIYISIYI